MDAEGGVHDGGLSQFVGVDAASLDGVRLLGVFAHPDDEVFCVGGTFARCVEAGASASVVSLTRGEAGQIGDAAAATRRTLGAAAPPSSTAPAPRSDWPPRPASTSAMDASRAARWPM